MSPKAQRMATKNPFSWQVTLLPILFIIFTAGTLSFLDILELQEDKKEQIEKATAEFISEQKERAKNRVMTASELIRFQSGRTLDLVRTRVRGRVDEAIHIATAFYNEYHKILPRNDLKEQIKLILSNAVFDHPDGYFFAVDMDTEEIILHKLDHLIGYSMSQHEDLRGQLVLAEQKKLLSQRDGAFQTIYFSKPTEPGKEFPKQLYVRYFKPFNWLIGTGEYLDDMEKRLKESVLQRLKALYTGDNEYLFINEIYNLEGGGDKPYGISLLSGHSAYYEGQPLFVTEQDSQGNYFGREILKLLRNQGEGFFSYRHPSSKGDNEVRKTSFFLYDKAWNWAIGSGFYYDALEKQLTGIEKNIEEKISDQIRASIAITFLIIVAMSTIFFLISRKITKTIDRYSRELQQAQKMESIGRLAGGVAHDFNNMLGVILGYSDLLLVKLSPNDSNYRFIKEIGNAARRSAEITRQLLAFSRQEAISPKTLDINESIENLVTMIKRLIGEDIAFSWHPGSGLWPIFMDTSQFNQIIMNLCVNARDAIDGTGIISIETRNITLDQRYFKKDHEFSPGVYVLLSISDTGSGMDKKTQEKLFEPFFTTKEPGKGTGLGLSTVYGILKQNKGFINVYSEPGKGTTFNLYFPKHEAETIAKMESQALKQDIFGSETILLLEDEKAVLKMTTLMLRELGYTVLPCQSPEQAMKTAEEFRAGPIDLLITDVVMPGMNGREISQSLQECYPAMKTLFMSGYTADVITHRGILWEGINFVQKPFSKNDLGLKVREILCDANISEQR